MTDKNKSVKYIIIVILVMVFLGRCAYYNLPLKSDEILQRNMRLMIIDNTVKKSKYMHELFQGDWDRVCVFTQEYTDIDDIKSGIGIDVSHTRARVWIGNEIDGTVLFIKNNKVLSAQKIYVGNVLAKPEGDNKNLWCGNRDTTITVNIKNLNGKNLNGKSYEYKVHDLIISLR